ncbi:MULTISPECIES: hypothetical protein [Glycomyces]|uniref:Uncharacterized protein n=2 Tax=Glycomyces TaxID=58113 RepID=A0A9X3STI6_9ACTN|nr:hypothetical protein [Glycomyces lechevalierae]MDA1384345.1 hypothetical protein [Glycomyces lechevalierae]MDR7339222.1 hypothetical protein [Glycomyces lechevalierae]
MEVDEPVTSLRLDAVSISGMIQAASRINRDTAADLDFVLYAPTGSGKSRVFVELVDEWNQIFRLPSGDDKRSRVRTAFEAIQSASTVESRRSAARAFLAALSDLICDLRILLARILMILLSLLMGRQGSASSAPVWKIHPLKIYPQVTPRGSNYSFPVLVRRGSHEGSSLGASF